MAFWNFSHNILHMHVYMLPSILVGICMIVAGLVHKNKQDDREDEYNKELSGEQPEAPKVTE